MCTPNSIHGPDKSMQPSFYNGFEYNYVKTRVYDSATLKLESYNNKKSFKKWSEGKFIISVEIKWSSKLVDITYYTEFV